MNLDDESVGGIELGRLQGWMQAVITHPGGVGAGVASPAARRRVAVDAKSLETIVIPSETLTGAERLAIYSRSYHARLLQCMREMLPALYHALGEGLFNLFALDYLQHHPPRSYTLDNLADRFVQHLAETRPDSNALPSERESWPDFIVELVAMEWAFLKVYDGDGLEGRALPSAAGIRALDLERILESRPAPAPCLRLFAFRYPVHAYMLAVRRGERPPIPAPSETFVAATRSDFRVMLYELSAQQYAVLKAFDGQHALKDALDQIGSVSSPRPHAATIRDWLCDWASKGFLETV
ncbi:MAG: DNA-binding domain-containing protein [Acidobacteria bacterium]|nr:DNA-binding domain-containing protein [Acidobacteriota bacterium]